MSVSRELVREYADSLRGRIAGDLRLDAVSRALYATDASMYEVMPVALLLPRHVEDVQAAVESAHALGVPVLPRGGGSSLAGQTVNEAVVIDFSKHLDAVLEEDFVTGRIRVQPGITHERVNRRVSDSGWMLGPDPASGSRATIGGMLANNATGTHSILYGNTIRHVESATAILSDGTVVNWGAMDESEWRARTRSSGFEARLLESLLDLTVRHGPTIRRDMPAHWRRNNGYRVEELLEDRPNPARLLCGSEGTLAVVTDCWIDLVRKPPCTSVGVVHFESRRAALEAVTVILQTEPSAVELFDGAAIRQCRASRGFADRMSWVQGTPQAVLITEYFATSAGEAHEALGRLHHAVAADSGATGIVELKEPGDIAAMWSVRKEALGLIMGVRGNLKPVAFIEDASVPVEHLADYVADLERVFEETGTEAVLYAHASAGCLHVRPFIDTAKASDLARMEAVAAASADLVKKYEGWVSSEHGDGLARSWLNPGFLGPELYEVCRQVKAAFDPSRILNPGRVIDGPRMTQNLRSGPDYKTIPVITDLDFSQEGGFDRAIELCNGNGACRRLDAGSMCPSFMATREEADSTRGRANVLRTALAGRIEAVGPTDAAVYDVLDLCVQCKACKTECPSSVDMAKIKTEWLSQYWRRHRIPVRTRIFAHFPKMSRLASGRWARAVNAVAAARPVRLLLDLLMGIDRRRTLPAFARHPFSPGRAVAPSEVPARSDRVVVLFIDTFHTHQHPEVARAAIRVLEAAGYDVIPVGDVCCGRTFLSKGLVTRAQLEAISAVERLYPFVERGIPVVGLEPSCILTLTDEFRSLLPGDPRTTAVADAAVTFEQFMASEKSAGRLRSLRLGPAGAPILVHGHCHQKALTGMGASQECLGLLPGGDVSLIDAACCGMAGAFGYEKEHYDVSLAMAEDRLAPAIRQSDPGAMIVAAGTSCRAQIFDVTGRRALHPAEVLDQALET